jgi:phage host-nuclease inhibitor protein Gam
MSAALQLATSVAEWTRLKTELREIHGLEPDDDALDDTLDGELSLGDQIHALLRVACENELFAEALDKRITEYKARKDRLSRAAKAIRQHVAEAALEAGLKKLPRPDMTVSFGLSKPALVGDADPDTLPDALVRTKREINRTAIKAALDAGQDVPGFTISNGRPTCTVRLS